jgi:hypothetical protein
MMKITIESTDQITDLDGVPVRAWKGQTERGVPCIVFVHRIAFSQGANSRELEAELKECL